MELSQAFIKGFVPAKPIEDYDGVQINEMIASGRLVHITRKRNGWKLYILIDNNGRVKIYNTGWHSVEAKMPHIVAQILKLGFSANTLLAGEGFIVINGLDNLEKLGSVMKIKDPHKAIELQEKIGFIQVALFSAYFLNGLELADRPIDQVFQLLRDKIRSDIAPNISVVETIYEKFEYACKLAKQKDWEGLVVFASTYLLTYEHEKEKKETSSAKPAKKRPKEPKRPKGCYKWKDAYEGDFIIRPEDIIRHPDGRFKDVVLIQRDPKNKNIEYDCGHLGNFSARDKELLDGLKWPIVAEVGFETRNSETGKIRFAWFKRFRDDKKVHECIAPKSYKEPIKRKKK